jgi:hypothetical protein
VASSPGCPKTLPEQGFGTARGDFATLRAVRGDITGRSIALLRVGLSRHQAILSFHADERRHTKTSKRLLQLLFRFALMSRRPRAVSSNSRRLAMTRSISEADYKLFRRLQSVALDRFCQRILTEIAHIGSSTGQTAHERYLAIYRLIERRDREMADAFNGPRRSTAWQQLACIQGHELLTEEEMSRFSPETQAVMQLFLGRE